MASEADRKLVEDVLHQVCAMTHDHQNECVALQQWGPNLCPMFKHSLPLFASLLSSERAKVRQEVREEDCRAVCEWCAPRKPSDIEEKAKPAVWRDGKWWHLVELPDGTAHPYQFWRECTAAPIRSLSLPEPDPPTAFDRHFLANCKYGEGHAGKCVPWPPKPEPTR